MHVHHRSLRSVSDVRRFLFAIAEIAQSIIEKYRQLGAIGMGVENAQAERLLRVCGPVTATSGTAQLIHVLSTILVEGLTLTSGMEESVRAALNPCLGSITTTPHDATDDTFASMVEAGFVVDPTASMQAIDVQAALRGMGRISTPEAGRFKAYLSKHHGVEVVAVRTGLVYRGIRLRTDGDVVVAGGAL